MELIFILYTDNLIIDQSAGMLRRVRERFPQVRYEKMGVQEMTFRAAFDVVICMETMEHISAPGFSACCGAGKTIPLKQV